MAETVNRQLRISLTILLVLVAITVVPSCRRPSEADVTITARHGKSLRGEIDGHPFLLLRGTHEQRGRDYGFLAAEDIVKLVDNVVRSAGAGFRSVGRYAYEELLLWQASKFRWPDRYETELAAMLEGIREAMPDPEDRRLEALKREISLEDLKAVNVIADLVSLDCSSLAAWGEAAPQGRLVVGRNLDFLSSWGMVSGQCIIAVEPRERGLKRTLSVSWFGMVGCYTAMNSEGVFVAIHNAPGLDSDAEDGWVPRTICLRSAIEKATAASAVQDVAGALRGKAVRIGNNVLVAAPAAGASGPQVAVIEWDGNGRSDGVTVRHPNADEPPGSITCTNHYVARGDRQFLFSRSKRRYRTLLERVGDFAAGRKKADFEGLRKALDAVAMRGIAHTVHAMVVWPEEKKLAVGYARRAFTSPKRAGWFHFTWNDLFKAGGRS
ncbi:MAG: C45 family autoproteolytic acyltransferase/hydrolase [Planctomycetota bacterium]